MTDNMDQTNQSAPVGVPAVPQTQGVLDGNTPVATVQSSNAADTGDSVSGSSGGQPTPSMSSTGAFDFSYPSQGDTSSSNPSVSAGQAGSGVQPAGLVTGTSLPGSVGGGGPVPSQEPSLSTSSPAVSIPTVSEPSTPVAGAILSISTDTSTSTSALSGMSEQTASVPPAGVTDSGIADSKTGTADGKDEDEDEEEDTGNAGTPAGAPLADLAQKLSTWKQDVMTEPQAPVNEQTQVRNPLAPEMGAPSPVSGGMMASSLSPTLSAGPGTGMGGVGSSAGSKGTDSTLAKQMNKPQNGMTSSLSGTTAGQVVTIQGSNSGGKYPYTIDDLLQIVFEKDASDLHICVGYPAMIRLNGDLMPVGQELVTEDVASDLILPVLPESKRELLDVNREVDLAYTFRQDARFRINAFYAKGNMSAAFRLIPNNIRSIEDLKLPGVYHQLTRLPQGLVLVTGPTGHGKSTTLAAIIQEINETYPKHIITIEDPIEYIYPRARAMVEQREMHEDTHSWEIALRSAMREDPNVVLVGEMRDFETIQAAITLAETGHLVLATLHTNNAAQTIDRVVDVFPEHQQEQVQTQISMILEAIISQRLVPVKSGSRRAVSEVLLATGAVRNLIREGKSHQIDNVIRTSLDIGMKTLEHSLVDLVREGEITVEEAEGIAVHPEEIARLMKA